MQIIASAPARLPLSEVGSFARRIEDLGYDVLHVPETVHDPFTVAALAVTRTTRLVVRTSMVVAFPRSPMVTAYAAWDLTELSGGRFQLGIASQVRGNIVGRFSTPWSEPVARLRDYVGSLRAIFHSFQTGADLDYTGSHYRFERLQPYFNPGPIDHPAPPIWTGGVNERMCVLAGEVSDGFVCHPTSSHPRMLDHRIRPALARGAHGRAHRTGPALVVAPQPLLAATPVSSRRSARTATRAGLPVQHPRLPQAVGGVRPRRGGRGAVGNGPAQGLDRARRPRERRGHRDARPAGHLRSDALDPP